MTLLHGLTGTLQHPLHPSQTPAQAPGNSEATWAQNPTHRVSSSTPRKAAFLGPSTYFSKKMRQRMFLTIRAIAIRAIDIGSAESAPTTHKSAPLNFEAACQYAFAICFLPETEGT